MAFYLDAEFAQLGDPSPNRGACDANFFGDFLAADDEHGAIGKQGEERVELAIGGAGWNGRFGSRRHVCKNVYASCKIR
jgi:hypothetical protein